MGQCDVRYFRLIESIPGRTSLGYGLGGGRWNSYGTPIIYGSNVSALNFLELLSIKGPVVSSSTWLLTILEISEDLPYLDIDDLPENWKNRPYPLSTQQIGTEWAKQLMSPVLKIPSCRIPLSRYPEEHNLLINPFHPEFTNVVKVNSEEKVSFEINRN